MEHCHRVLDGCFRGYALDRLHHDAAGLLVGGHLGVVHYVVDVRCRGGLGLILEAFDEFLPGFAGSESRDVLEHVLCACVHFVHLGLACGQGCLLVFEAGAHVVVLLLGALVLALLLVELHLALLYFGFGALHAALALLSLLFGFGGDAQSFLASLENLVVAQVLGFFLRFGDYQPCPRSGHALLHEQGCESPRRCRHYGHCYCDDVCFHYV